MKHALLGLALLLTAGLRPAPAIDHWLVGKLGPGRDSAPGLVLSEDDRYYLVAMTEAEADRAKAAGFMLKRTRLTADSRRPVDADETVVWTPDTIVARLVERVSLDSLAKDIRRLQNFVTRHTLRDSCDSCAAWLYRRFAAENLAVEYDTYRYQGNLSFNVIATLPGRVVPESIVVICAHFDSYTQTPNNAPGADDNATGTAILLEAARLFRDVHFRWTVILAAFSGEEQWMKGSYHWVDSVVVPRQMKIGAVYNVDMVGYTAYESTYHVVNYNSPSAPLAALCDSVNRWYSIGLDHLLLYYDPDCAGDNTPFWERGFKAVFALEDSEWGIWRGSNPWYHTVGDTFGTLRMGQVRRVCQMALAAAATIAGPIEWVGVKEGTGEPEESRNPVAVFPNPFVRFAVVPGRERERFTLLDVTGRPVAEHRGDRIGQALPAGIYYIRPAGGMRIQTGRLVKLR
uniref:M28 family peptidase n=1 Tax=candidate division WOR-3 bacterium TaxID=2052148 RepID=A0A7C4GGA9_UNCW3